MAVQMTLAELKQEVTQLEIAELGVAVEKCGAANVALSDVGMRIFRRLCFQYTAFHEAEAEKQRLLRQRTRGERDRPI